MSPGERLLLCPFRFQGGKVVTLGCRIIPCDLLPPSPYFVKVLYIKLPLSYPICVCLLFLDQTQTDKCNWPKVILLREQGFKPGNLVPEAILALSEKNQNPTISHLVPEGKMVLLCIPEAGKS